MENQERKKSFEKFYDKSYKFILLIPIIFLIISLGYLYNFSQEHGDIILKDITLKGGTSLEIQGDYDIVAIRQSLQENFDDITIRYVTDITSGENIAIIIETSATPEELKPFMENLLGIKLTEENSSVEFTGSSLSDSFYNQLKFAILISFIFMAVVVFFIFKKFIPSIAVVFAGLSDIIMTLFIVDLLGMRLSTAGIVAFLMLIGYSVDTDILLTTRVIKRKQGSINSRIWDATKTGLTMTLTSLAVVIIGLILTSSFSSVFNQIFTILTIGLIFDIFNTWLFNASIIKWYAEKNE